LKIRELLHSPKPILVEFAAEWCAPCKQLHPVLKELGSRVGDSIRVLIIDIEKNPGLSNHYSVQSAPTLILFMYGKPIWRGTGIYSVHALEKIVNHYVAKKKKKRKPWGDP
jgi:thioredoxin 1